MAFLKAVKAKDIDALMKTVDVPFLIEGKGEPFTRTDELKESLTTFLTKIMPDRVPTELGKTLDLKAVRKEFEGKSDTKPLERIEQVLNKSGYAVFLKRDGKERGALLVRIKDGKAIVVGIPR